MIIIFFLVLQEMNNARPLLPKSRKSRNQRVVYLFAIVIDNGVLRFSCSANDEW
jgi:hypothetical protein